MKHSLFIKKINNAVKSLNTSKFFAGIIMIIMNIGSRYITVKFSPTVENYIRYGLSKQILIFSMCWMASRDIYISITLTASFLILSEFLFNDESKLCIVPEKYRALTDVMDQNKDGKIDQDEINRAIEILQKANKQKEQMNQKTIYAEYFQEKMK
jgi:hypothetical protein